MLEISDSGTLGIDKMMCCNVTVVIALGSGIMTFHDQKIIAVEIYTPIFHPERENMYEVDNSNSILAFNPLSVRLLPPLDASTQM